MTKSGNFRRPKPVNVEANKLCEKVTKISQKLTKFSTFFLARIYYISRLNLLHFSPEFLGISPLCEFHSN